MSYEIEQKFRTEGHERIVDRLAELPAEPGERIEQEDTYLKHPARDFARTGEAFRVRRFGDHNAITYKGPKRQGPTKTREEIEILFESGPGSLQKLLQLFEMLGFQAVTSIRKVRTPYHLTFQAHAIEVVLDVVEGIGTYVEVETIVEAENQMPEAQRTVVELAARLGLTEVEPRSYLRMVLENRPAAADS
jgi:adenylate cyclase class 2